MNKILLLLFCVFTVSSVASAQLFEANFDDGTLNGMTTIDNDGQPINGNVTGIDGAFSVISITNDGFDTPFAASASWFANGALTADDYLITPGLQLDSPDYFFKFEARAVSAGYPDGYEVLVSTTDSLVGSFNDVLFSINAESADQWEERFFSLADYDGQKVFVAIRNNSTDEFILAIDNVEVVEISGREITALGFTNNRWNLSGGDVNMFLRNSGAETIESMTVDYTVVLPVDLAGVAEFEIDYMITTINGEADILDDNSATVTLNSQAALTDVRSVVEEGTGTWCGWCPRGHVFMEAMAEDYPEDFIGIAAHDNDPMVVAEHDNGLGFTGFPTAIMNRAIDMDPSQIEAFLPEGNSRVVPLTVGAELDYNEDTREGVITASAISAVNASNINLRFSVIITEDEVVRTTSNYAQANYYAGGAAGAMGGYESLSDPVPAADMVYNDVSRAILGGFNGMASSIPSSLVEGEMYTMTFSYTVPADYNPMHMQAVVLVIDEDGSILNADETIFQMPVNTQDISDIQSVTLFPNPATNMVNVELALEATTDINISLIDFTGKVVYNNSFENVNSNTTIPVSIENVISGVYLVKIDSQEGSTVKRLVVSN